MLAFHAVPLRLALAASALGIAVTLAGCGSSSSPQADDAGDGGDAGAGAASSTDVCALVPQDALTAFLGKDPGAGVPEAGKIGGGQCTWNTSDTSSVLVQYTHQPDQYFPAEVYPKPDGATDVPGADRGFAAASSNTILIVKGGNGLMLSNISFGSTPPSQAQYDTLAAAIAAKL